VSLSSAFPAYQYSDTQEASEFRKWQDKETLLLRLSCTFNLWPLGKLLFRSVNSIKLRWRALIWKWKVLEVYKKVTLLSIHTSPIVSPPKISPLKVWLFCHLNPRFCLLAFCFQRLILLYCLASTLQAPGPWHWKYKQLWYWPLCWFHCVTKAIGDRVSPIFFLSPAAITQVIWVPSYCLPSQYQACSPQAHE
jgi:hypothetical protein